MCLRKTCQIHIDKENVFNREVPSNVPVKQKNVRYKRTSGISRNEETPVATTGAIMKNLCAICLVSEAE